MQQCILWIVHKLFKHCINFHFVFIERHPIKYKHNILNGSCKLLSICPLCALSVKVTVVNFQLSRFNQTWLMSSIVNSLYLWNRKHNSPVNVYYFLYTVGQIVHFTGNKYFLKIYLLYLFFITFDINGKMHFLFEWVSVIFYYKQPTYNKYVLKCHSLKPFWNK